MEKKISELTDHEIEEMIRDLEHVYAEFLGSEAPIKDLLTVHRQILKLKEEMRLRGTQNQISNIN